MLDHRISFSCVFFTANATAHIAMEERAKARAERKSLLEEKKRAAEEEKLVSVCSLNLEWNLFHGIVVC